MPDLRIARDDDRIMIHADAEVLAETTSAPSTALIVRQVGADSARHLATVPGEDGAQSVVDRLPAATGVEPVAAGLPSHGEAARRGRLLTLVNHGGPAASVVEGTDAVTGRWVDGVAPEAYDWCMALPD